MKILTISTLLTAMYSSPVIALSLMLALVFLIDLLNRYWESRKITCVPIDFPDWSYREIQQLSKAHGIKANKSRAALLEGLASI